MRPPPQWGVPAPPRPADQAPILPHSDLRPDVKHRGLTKPSICSILRSSGTPSARSGQPAGGVRRDGRFGCGPGQRLTSLVPARTSPTAPELKPGNERAPPLRSVANRHLRRAAYLLSAPPIRTAPDASASGPRRPGRRGPVMRARGVACCSSDRNLIGRETVSQASTASSRHRAPRGSENSWTGTTNNAVQCSAVGFSPSRIPLAKSVSGRWWSGSTRCAPGARRRPLGATTPRGRSQADRLPRAHGRTARAPRRRRPPPGARDAEFANGILEGLRRFRDGSHRHGGGCRSRRRDESRNYSPSR